MSAIKSWRRLFFAVTMVTVGLSGVGVSASTQPPIQPVGSGPFWNMPITGHVSKISRVCGQDGLVATVSVKKDPKNYPVMFIFSAQNPKLSLHSDLNDYISTVVVNVPVHNSRVSIKRPFVDRLVQQHVLELSNVNPDTIYWSDAVDFSAINHGKDFGTLTLGTLNCAGIYAANVPVKVTLGGLQTGTIHGVVSNATLHTTMANGVLTALSSTLKLGFSSSVSDPPAPASLVMALTQNAGRWKGQLTILNAELGGTLSLLPTTVNFASNGIITGTARSLPWTIGSKKGFITAEWQIG